MKSPCKKDVGAVCCHITVKYYNFSKNDDEGGRGQKSQKNDDIFYEWPLTMIFD